MTLYMPCSRTPSPLPVTEQPTAVYAQIVTVTGLLDRLFSTPTDAGLLELLEQHNPVELVTQATLDGTHSMMLAQLNMLAQTTPDAAIRARLQRLHQTLSTTTPAFFVAMTPRSQAPIVWVNK